MSAVVHVTCDAAAAGAQPAAVPARHPRLVLATTILASSLAFVDGSVVNVGLPAIGRSLGADADMLPWVVNAYLLPLSALLLLGGAAGDRYGRRPLLIGGIALFAVASLVCAIAPDLSTMFVGRMLQGVGAAILMPNSLAILGATFTGEAKGRAIGTWAATGAIAGAVGPVIGGWLIDLGNWRAIFLLNLPLAAAAIGLAWRSVPVDFDDSAETLDWTGGLLATASLGLLTFALTVGSGRIGWTSHARLAAVLGAGLFVAFLMAERGRGDRAMMPVALFASKAFVGLTLLTLTLYGALGAMLVVVPYVLIEAGGYGGTAAGAALLPLPLILSVTSPIAGALAGKLGARLFLSVGPLVVAAGFALALRIDGDADYWSQILPCVVVIALGMSFAVAPLTTAVLGSVDDRRTGSASGFNSAVARAGGLVATALLGGVLGLQGPALIASFHTVMIAGVGACVIAAASAFLLIPPQTRAG